MIELLWFIPCAIANRIRGGWLANDIRRFFPIWATLPSRVFFSGVLSVPLFFTQPIKISLTFFGLLFIGLLFRWAPWQFMDDPLRDITILTLRGLLLTAPSGFICELYVFGFSGALMGLSYWLSYQLPFHHKQRDGYEWVGSDWGELIFGGVLGLFLWINIHLK